MCLWWAVKNIWTLMTMNSYFVFGSRGGGTHSVCGCNRALVHQRQASANTTVNHLPTYYKSY